MKRRLAIAAVCLILGAVINVLVAWGIGAVTDLRPLLNVARSAPGPTLTSDRIPGQSITYSRLGPGRSWGVSASMWFDNLHYNGYKRIDRAATRRRVPYIVLECGYGWPMRSMRAWQPFFEMPSGGAADELEAVGMASAWIIGLPSPYRRQPGSQQRARIPLEPLHPGFAVNTACFGTLIWLVALGPFALRRSLRRRGGRCERWGYDLVGLSKCPEHGVES